MTNQKTNYDKIREKLFAVGATLEQEFDNSTDKFEASAHLEFWKVAGQPLLVVSSAEGDCGLYPFLGRDGDPVEMDLLFIDRLTSSLPPDEEIVFDGLLTKEEFIALSQSIKREGVIDEDEMNRLVRWASRIQGQAESVKMLIEGWMKIDGWHGDRPNIVPTDETLDFIGGFDLTAPMLEESNYAAIQTK